MHVFEDNDIKIFNSAKKVSEADVLIGVVEVMKKQRANGNIDRAKLLGKCVARQIYSPENMQLSVAEKIKEYKENETVYEQIKMLVTFVAEANIHVLLDKYSISTMAANALYDELITLDDDLYDNITNAFTYYYLVLRKGGNIEENMGRKFAKLCNDKENEALQKLGTEIYLSIQAEIKKEIENANFAND